MLKAEGLALVWTGAGDLQYSIEEGFCGSPMYWNHYDVSTNLTILRDCGFWVLWSKLGDDHVDPRAKHLFALDQKS